MSTKILNFPQPEPKKEQKYLFCPNCFNSGFKLLEDGSGECTNKECKTKYQFLIWYLNMPKGS